MTTNTTVEKYAKVLGNWAKTQGPIRRPPKGDYNLELHDVTVTDGEFRYNPTPDKPDATKKVIEGVTFLWRWHMEEDPSSGQSLTFPGRFFTVPLIDDDELEALPPGQQTRVRIAWEQIKNNLVKLIGYDPDNPFEAAEGFGEHVREALKEGDPVKARVRIAYNKQRTEDFEADKVIRLIT